MVTGKHSLNEKSGTGGRMESPRVRKFFRASDSDTLRFGLQAHYGEPSFKTVLYRQIGALVDRKWLVLGFALIGIIISVAFAFTRTPVYISSAVLRIEANPQQAVGLSNLFDSFAYFSIFYQAQLELLKTGSLPADQTSGTPRPDASGIKPGDPNGNTARSTENVAASKRQKPSFTKMSVGGDEDTRLIRLEMASSDPMSAREELRKYIEDYIESDRVQRDQIARSIEAGLRKEMEQAEDRLRKSQEELLDFSIRNNVVGLKNNPTPNLAFFDSARDNYLASQTERWRLEGVQKDLGRMLPAKKTDEVLQGLKAKAASMRSEYEALGPYFGPRNLRRELLKSKAQSLEKAVEEIETGTLTASLEAARNKEIQAREAYEKAKREAMKSDSIGLKYQILKKTVEADGQLYLKSARQFREAEFYDAMADELIAVESSPTLPLQPVYPNRRKIIGIGTLLSIICAVGLALLLGQLDKAVKTLDEIRAELGVPALGVVPRIISTALAPSGGEDVIKSPELSPYQWPTSPLADSLRIILNGIAMQVDLDSKVAIAVSSALPGEGKTFLVVSLAAALASEAKAVLVIDGDLRNPGIPRILGNRSDSAGFSDYLAEKSQSILQAVRETPIPGLYYLPGGPMPSNPVSALKSPSMREIIRICKKAFDLVLIDTPPLLGMADAAVLMGYSDGLILVAKQGYTSLDVIRAASEEIKRGKGRLLGIVLNMVERRLGSYDYYHAEQYARYHHRQI